MATSETIPGDVLERAAEASLASLGHRPQGNTTHFHRQEVEGMADLLRAALPVLVPAIQRSLVEQMIADAENSIRGLRAVEYQPGSMMSELTVRAIKETESIADYLRTYLPKEGE